MKLEKEKKSLEKERTVVPAFFSRQPLLPHAQRFSSNPVIIPSPKRSLAPPFLAPNVTRSPTDTLQNSSSEFSDAVSPDTVTNSISSRPRTISQNSSFSLPSPAKFPGKPAKTVGSQKKKSSAPEVSSYDYELRPSPLHFPSSLNENALSSLMLEAAIFETNSDTFSAEEEFNAYKFIFKFSFGDACTQKECSAKFFNSTAVIDARISTPVKQFFYKLLLKSLNPEPIKAKLLDPNSIEAKRLYPKSTEAKMLLGISADDRQLPALKEILRYLKEEMPSPRGIDVEAYIKALAEKRCAGEFPYADLEEEKFDFLRYALQQNYGFFEYIFTANDTYPEKEFYTFFRIQRWLYHSLFYQFRLSNDEDKNEEEIQTLSKLKVAYPDLQQALYQHFKTLLKKNKSLSTSSTKTAFLLVYLLSFEWIHKNIAETELNDLFDLLLQTSAGIRFLCAVKDAGKVRPIEKWLNLLEEKLAFKLFDKIVSILPCLNPKQVLALLDSTLMHILTDYLSPEQELQLLHKLLDLNLSVVDMHICEDRELMQMAKKHGLVEMLRKIIWHSFSLESLEAEDNEIRRAFLSDDRLIVENNKILAELLDRPVLNTFLLEKFHNIQYVLELNTLQHDWIIAYKKIYRLILDCWMPSDKDLYEISRIKEEWSNSMTKRLSERTSDYSAYNPQNYTVDKLPQMMRAALEERVDVLNLYQEQLSIMADRHHRLIACVRIPYSADTPSSARENRIPFIELIVTLAAQKGMKCTEAQIQACAEDLSRWFKEVIATGEVYPLAPMFFGLTKNSFEAANILYLSTRYAELFLELLENAMPKKSSFSMFLSTGIVLREKETKDAIDTFLRTLIKPKPVRYKDSPVSMTIVRGTPSTILRAERTHASPLLLSPVSSSSPKL